MLFLQGPGSTVRPHGQGRAGSTVSAHMATLPLVASFPTLGPAGASKLLDSGRMVAFDPGLPPPQPRFYLSWQVWALPGVLLWAGPAGARDPGNQLTQDNLKMALIS